MEGSIIETLNYNNNSNGNSTPGSPNSQRKPFSVSTYSAPNNNRDDLKTSALLSSKPPSPPPRKLSTSTQNGETSSKTEGKVVETKELNLGKSRNVQTKATPTSSLKSMNDILDDEVSNITKNSAKKLISSSGSSQMGQDTEDNINLSDYDSNSSDDEIDKPLGEEEEEDEEDKIVPLENSKTEREVKDVENLLGDVFTLPEDGLEAFNYDSFINLCDRYNYNILLMKEKKIVMPSLHPGLLTNKDLIQFCKGYRTATVSSGYSLLGQKQQFARLESTMIKLSNSHAKVLESLEVKPVEKQPEQTFLVGAVRTLTRWGIQIGKIPKREVLESLLSMNQETYKEFIKKEATRMKAKDHANWDWAL